MGIKKNNKIAIIGASYLQEPLIRRAKEMGYETHVFAWKCGDIGETIADYFYPISIVETEEILECCRIINICAICTIASDLAVKTVNYVADKMGLVGNSIHATEISTNKHKMRLAFSQKACPSTESTACYSMEDMVKFEDAVYPLIVKPSDRSGSRGVTRVEDYSELRLAFEDAFNQSFQKEIVVEKFITGDEYSVEGMSYKGKHTILTVTKKYTTGSPNYIENGHMEPALLDNITYNKVSKVVADALDALEIKNGASHSEIKIENGEIRLIEIGGRMGGDFIGSDLVYITTGIDYVGNVIRIAVGEEPVIDRGENVNNAAIRFIFNDKDIERFNKIKEKYPDIVVKSEVNDEEMDAVTDSSGRHGYYIVVSQDRKIIEDCMSDLEEKNEESI